MRNANWLLATALVVFNWNASAAETPTRDEAKPSSELSAKSAASTRESLLGVDADGDGIRDDIEAIVAKTDTTPKAEAKAASTTEAALAPLGERESVRKAPQRRTCMDYLMMGPKDRSKTDMRVQQRTNGAIGTHPCDPIVSPLLERPFETDFAQLDLGPVSLRY